MERDEIDSISLMASAWLLGTVSGIVDDKAAVSVLRPEFVNGSNGENITPQTSITFNVEVAEGDLGKVIGKNGRTARSLRTLLSARGMTDGLRYVLNVSQKREV